MLRHIFKHCLNVGKSSVSQHVHSIENVVFCKEKHFVGYVLFKHSYCTETKSQVRNTSQDVKNAIQEEFAKLLQDPEKQKAYNILQHKLKVLRYQGNSVPTELSTKDTMILLNLSDRATRKYLNVLYKREQVNKKVAEIKEAKKNKKYESYTLSAFDGEQLHYGLHKNSMFLRIYPKTINTFLHYRMFNAMMFEQPLVFDMSYEQHMTYREKLACAKQITLSFGQNRLHSQPFHMYLCGAKEDSVVMKTLFYQMPTIFDETFPMSISPKYYLDLFDKSKIVYLTPHTNNVLTKFDQDAVYILGGMVDKGVSVPLSLAKAKKDGVVTARLPLDEHLSWGHGGKSLTLDQMTNILLDVRMSNDWINALKHIPRRKLGSNIRNLFKKHRNKTFS